MANVKINNGFKVAVLIDTAPSSEGFWTDQASITPYPTIRDNEGLKHLVFIVQESTTGVSSVVIPTLQFRTQDGVWTDYNEEFNVGDCKIVAGNAIGLLWRAGVKAGNYTSGSVALSLNW